MIRSVVLAFYLLVGIVAFAQDLTPPIPQRLTVHSRVLNEDREVWIRLPKDYPRGKKAYPVLYLTDGPDHINQVGATIDFLVENDRMPEVIMVGIENNNRIRDLTVMRSSDKSADGSLVFPSSGGGGSFLDFVQRELMPEIDKRYQTAPYHILAGYSLGGLLAVEALITRAEAFDAYIAVSPSLQWDNDAIVARMRQFFGGRDKLNKIFFFSLADEGDGGRPIGKDFEQIEKVLSEVSPKGFVWSSAHFPDEDHGSTVLRAYYAGLRAVFPDWKIKFGENGSLLRFGLVGIEQHYNDLSARYRYEINPPEGLLNALGYQLRDAKRYDDAIVAFKRNVQLYPDSPNTYDSLGEGLEAAGQLEQAVANYRKAVDLGTRDKLPLTGQFKQHLDRVSAQLRTVSPGEPAK